MLYEVITPNNKFNYPIEMPSFYRELKKNGYNVGGVGKFDLNKPEPYWGEDGFWEELVITSYSIHYTKLYDSSSNSTATLPNTTSHGPGRYGASASMPPS